MIGPALLRKMIPFPFKFGESGTPILAPIIKELFMFRTNRRQPELDSLEGVLLLSAGVARARQWFKVTAHRDYISN